MFFNKKILFLIIPIFFVISNSNAIIISPPIINIDYEPGKTVNWGFNVGGLKEENQTILLRAFVIGNLNSSIRIFTNETFSLQKGQWVQVGGTMLLPSSIKPGIHRNGVVVVQVPDDKAGIYALIGVEYTINVLVPYPGKYLESILDVSNSNVDGVITIKLKLISRGEETVNNADITFEILDYQGNKITTIKIKEENIATNDIRTIITEWNSKGSPYGEYRVVAKINYDGHVETLERGFRIGDVLIKIVNITGTEVEKGAIGKITIIGESQSNYFINNVFSLVEVPTENGILQLKSSSLNIDPFSRQEFTVFIDSNSFEIGNYNATATIFYEDKDTKQDFILKIKKGLLKSVASTQNILIIIIVILLSVIILNFIRFRKYKKNEKK